MKAAPLSDEQMRRKPEATKEFPWACHCGCSTFVIDWLVYTDFRGEPRIQCCACGRAQIITEPVVNGPH